jgi:hypothetical protein
MPSRHVFAKDRVGRLHAVPHELPQSVQSAEPVNILYFPVKHATHIPPLGPVAPVLHRQLLNRLLPAAELERVGQSKMPSTQTYGPSGLSPRL